MRPACPCRARLADASRQLVFDRTRVESARREQDVAVEPQVGDLLDDALVRLAERGDCRFDSLLADLARTGRDAFLEQRRNVRARRARLRALRDDAPQPRREARLRARVTRGAGGTDADEQRIAVAVVANLLDGE